MLLGANELTQINFQVVQLLALQIAGPAPPALALIVYSEQLSLLEFLTRIV